MISFEKNVENGVFRGLLQLMMDYENTKFWMHSRSSTKSAKYASPLVHNDIVNSIGNAIRDTTLNRAKNAKCFSILADEMSDIASKEQLFLVVSSYDDYQIEEFFAFQHYKCRD